MPEKVVVKVRRLPDGEPWDALEIASEGRFVELEIKGLSLSLGSLLEIERGTVLLWGELRQLIGSVALVWIEHSLDKSKLHPIQEIWGNELPAEAAPPGF